MGRHRVIGVTYRQFFSHPSYPWESYSHSKPMAPDPCQPNYLPLHNKLNGRKLQNRAVKLASALRRFPSECSRSGGGFMVTESTIFYLVLLTLLTWLLNVLLTKSSRRHDRHSHA